MRTQSVCPASPTTSIVAAGSSPGPGGHATRTKQTQPISTRKAHTFCTNRASCSRQAALIKAQSTAASPAFSPDRKEGNRRVHLKPCRRRAPTRGFGAYRRRTDTHTSRRARHAATRAAPNLRPKRATCRHPAAMPPRPLAKRSIAGTASVANLLPAIAYGRRAGFDARLRQASGGRNGYKLGSPHVQASTAKSLSGLRQHPGRQRRPRDYEYATRRQASGNNDCRTLPINFPYKPIYGEQSPAYSV